MISAQIGSFLLDTSNNIYLEQLDVDSSTPLGPQVFDTAARDGGKLVAAYFKTKQITIKGRVVGVDYPTLNANLDALKQNMMGVNLNLDVNDGTVCKRYIVTNQADVQIPRDRTMLTFANFSVTYLVIDPPFGIDAVQGGAINTFTALTSPNVTVDLFTSTLVFSGSAQPAAKVVVTFTNPGDLYALDVVDVSNSRSMNLTYAFAAGDVLVVDLVNYTVQVNGIDINYTGQLPNWQSVAGQQIGINGYTISGVNLDQTSVATGAPTAINGVQLFYKTSTIVAQQFNAGATAPISRVQLILNKVGNPLGNVRVTIQGGFGSSPGGTVFATYAIPASQISTVFAYVSCAFSPQYNASTATAYWIVVQADTTGDVNNYFQIRTITPGTYTSANNVYTVSQNSASTFTTVANTCLAFREFKSVTGQANATSDYASNQYLEGFSTTTKKDGFNTTANWDTTVPSLHMTGSLTPGTDTITTDNTINALLAAGTSAYAIILPFTVSKTGTLQTISVQLKRAASTESTAITVQVAASLPSGSGYGYFGTSDSHLVQSTLTTNYTSYTFTLNAPVVAGTTYFLEFLYPSPGSLSTAIYIQGGALPSGNFFYQYNNLSNNNGTYSSMGLNFSATTSYRVYGVQEQAQSLELAATNADILSVSQNTIATLAGGTYSGLASVDGGTTWFSVVNDSIPLTTDNIPAVAGTSLRMRWLLQNTATPTISPSITSTSLYWKKGISLDSSTKYAAESIMPVINGSIGRMDLFMAVVGAPGLISATIQSDASGSPSGTVITNGTSNALSSTSVLSTFGWVSFTFATPPTITAATQYWIVITVNTTASSTARYLLLANNNGYASGTLAKSTNSGSTWSFFTGAEDLLFRTYGTGGGNYNLNVQVTYNKRYL